MTDEQLLEATAGKWFKATTGKMWHFAAKVPGHSSKQNFCGQASFHYAKEKTKGPDIPTSGSVCKKCQRTWERMQALQLGLERYECSFCGKTFMTPSTDKAKDACPSCREKNRVCSGCGKICSERMAFEMGLCATCIRKASTGKVSDAVNMHTSVGEVVSIVDSIEADWDIEI